MSVDCAPTTHVPLAGFTTLALQANAKALLRVTTLGELRAAIAWSEAQGLALIPWGEGSNIVLAGDVEALVAPIGLRGIEVLELSDAAVTLKVAAGENWHAFVEWTLQRGYAGLENLALIPGTVGAAPIQNIGAYGVELGEFVVAVEGVHSTSGEFERIEAQHCGFGYRDSVFKRQLRDAFVVTDVEVCLPISRSPNLSYPALAQALETHTVDGNITPRQVFDAVVALRQRRLPDPAQCPNAGSFFKNPVVDAHHAAELAERFDDMPQYAQSDGRKKLPAAWLIQQCGWKGIERKGVGVHREHALVLVNHGSDSGEELLALAHDIRQSVLQMFAVELEVEPRIYGADA